MEVFEKEYYPQELSDWWMDDWISRVYGSTRTRQAHGIEVIHHTSAHGQRYAVDDSHAFLLDGLVEKGREKIKSWMVQKEMSQEEIKRFQSGRFDNFPLQDIR